MNNGTHGPRCITISLPLPEHHSGGNDRVHFQQRAAIRKREKTAAQLVTGSEMVRLGIEQPLGPVQLTYRWFFRGGRIDPDNIPSRCKAYVDGLVAAGLLTGDSYRWIRGLTVEIISDHADPRIELELRELAAPRQRQLV